MRLRIVKVGGSLLTMPDLLERMTNWLSGEPRFNTLLIVGGGPLVDSVRELAALREYDSEFLHWLCVDLLDTSFRLMAAQLPNAIAMATKAALDREMDQWRREGDCVPKLGIVSVSAYYRQDEPRTLPIELPLTWDTTTDSLSALLAHRTRADELVLLKSCDVPADADWFELADRGVVDRAFPMASRGLKHVRCVNLRSIKG